MKFFTTIALLGLTSSIKVSQLSFEGVKDDDKKPEPITAADIFRQCNYNKDDTLEFTEGMKCAWEGSFKMIYGWWPHSNTASSTKYWKFDDVEEMKGYMEKHPMKSHDKNNFVSFIVKNPKAEDIFKHCDLNKDKVVEV